MLNFGEDRKGRYQIEINLTGMLASGKFGDFFFVLQSVKIQKEYTNRKFTFFSTVMKTDATQNLYRPGQDLMVSLRLPDFKTIGA